MAFSEQLRESIGLMKLICRSEDAGDGWRNVGQNLRKCILDQLPKGRNPELIEHREENGLQVRLTSDGHVLMKYL